jgi:hypothetical protein
MVVELATTPSAWMDVELATTPSAWMDVELASFVSKPILHSSFLFFGDFYFL